MKIMTLLLMSVWIGCSAWAYPAAFAASNAHLSNAEKYLKAGEIYQAKKMTQLYLQANPGDLEAQKLMAKILDSEISQYKEAFESTPVEGLSTDQKSTEVKTWLERSKAYLEIGEYDEATLAAENVFRYDPENREATRLLDEIKGQAWARGKKEVGARNTTIEDEMSDRASAYREQAKQWLKEGKPGAARLALEKLLLMHPEDKEALQMLSEVRSSKIRGAMMDQALASAEVSDEERKTL